MHRISLLGIQKETLFFRRLQRERRLATDGAQCRANSENKLIPRQILRRLD